MAHNHHRRAQHTRCCPSHSSACLFCRRRRRAARLFSIVRYESVIHEFDPYFNYRVTQFLTKEGFYRMWDW